MPGKFHGPCRQVCLPGPKASCARSETAPLRRLLCSHVHRSRQRNTRPSPCQLLCLPVARLQNQAMYSHASEHCQGVRLQHEGRSCGIAALVRVRSCLEDAFATAAIQKNTANHAHRADTHKPGHIQCPGFSPGTIPVSQHLPTPKAHPASKVCHMRYSQAAPLRYSLHQRDSDPSMKEFRLWEAGKAQPSSLGCCPMLGGGRAHQA